MSGPQRIVAWVLGAIVAVIMLTQGTLDGMLPEPPAPPAPTHATIQETTLADGTRCAVLFYRSAVAINCEWKSP